MHQVDTELRMAVEGVLDERRITEAYPERPAARIERNSWISRPGVQADRHVEFLSKRKIRVILSITESETGIFRSHLPKYAQLTFLKSLAEHSDLRQRSVF